MIFKELKINLDDIYYSLVHRVAMWPKYCHKSFCYVRIDILISQNGVSAMLG
jgi:hypothetical protein